MVVPVLREFPHVRVAVDGEGGWEFKVNGQDVAGVRDLRVDFRLDDPPRVQVELLAVPELDFTGRVEMTVVALPGFTLLHEPLPVGGTRYRAVPDESLTAEARQQVVELAAAGLRSIALGGRYRP